MVPFSQRFFAMLRLRDNLAFATLAVVVAVVVVVVVAVVVVVVAVVVVAVVAVIVVVVVAAVVVVVAAFFTKENFLPGDAFQSIISGGFLLKKNIAILFVLLRKMIGRF